MAHEAGLPRRIEARDSHRASNRNVVVLQCLAELVLANSNHMFSRDAAEDERGSGVFGNRS